METHIFNKQEQEFQKRIAYLYLFLLLCNKIYFYVVSLLYYILKKTIISIDSNDYLMLGVIFSLLIFIFIAL